MVGHSLGSVSALHLAANTDLCQSVVFVNGLGMMPHRSVGTVHCSHCCLVEMMLHSHF